MQNLTGIHTLEKILKNDFKKYLISNISKTFLHEKGDYQSLPHLIFYAKTPFLTEMYIKQFLQNKFGIHNRELKSKEIQKEFFSEQFGRFDVNYVDHHYYKEFDVHLFTQAQYDKRLLIEFLKCIVMHKNVVTGKHIVYLKCVETLSSYCLISLIRLIELYSENAIFIFSTTRILLESKLSALACYVNVNINTELLVRELITEQKKSSVYLRALDVEQDTFQRMLMKHAHGDVVNVALLLDIPKPHLYIGYLQKTVESFLHYLTDSETIKNNNDISQRIKQMSVKMSASCIPFSEFVRITIHFFTLKYPEKIYEIVHLSTKLEHMAIISNKEVFCYEDYFFQIVNLACA